MYNISAGTGFTLKQFAAAVKRLYPDAQIEVGDGLGSNTTNVVMDSTRAREEFGFRVEGGADQIVSRYVATMKLLGLSPSA